MYIERTLYARSFIEWENAKSCFMELNILEMQKINKKKWRDRTGNKTNRSTLIS